MSKRTTRARQGLCTLVTVSALAVAGPGVGSAAPPATADDPAIVMAGSDKVEPALVDQFQTEGADQDFWVSFDARPDLAGAEGITDWARRGAFVVDRLRGAATEAQADAVEVLKASGVEYTSYWITNAIRVEGGDRLLAERLAADSGVDRVFAPVAYERPEPVTRELTGSRLAPGAAAVVEWGVANIHADQVWERFGVRGDGIVVGSIDSGAQLDHPSLVGAYRGYDAEAGTFDNDYNWLDVSGTSTYPKDDNGHGTHTMGTMVGDDGAANRIGVAPGAKWITANGCCPSDQALVDSAQWMLAPTKVDGSAPDPARRPHVVNNSWGTVDPSNDPFMEDILTAWSDAGIFGVWANGNSGDKGCTSSGAPGSRVLNYSTGAYDSSNAIAPFSARGPGQDGEVKPNISAPGVNVRSSLPGSQYGVLSGTSMAAPHLSGAVALAWSADPTLVGDLARTRDLLDATAVDTDDTRCGGTAEDNNVYGEGRLDALALVEATDPVEGGTITGTVTDAVGGAGVRGAVLSLTAGTLLRSVRTGDDGAYTATVAPGEYQATVSGFGFETTTVPITVTAGRTTTTDIALPAAKGFTVTGQVLDQTTGKAMTGASVRIAGTRFTATVGADGTFAVANVPGPRTYVVTVDGGRCATAPVHRSVDVAGDVALPVVRVPRKIDSAISEGWWDSPYGYSCGLEPTHWITGDTELDVPFGWGSVPVELPFAFPYFGKRYDTLHVGRHGLASFWTRGPDKTVFWGLKPFFALLDFDENSHVMTGTTGTAPNRAFTVEWRDVFLASSNLRFSFAVTLHENGDIVYAYADIDEDNLYERGAGADIRITGESPDGRATASTGLLYSNLEPSLNDDHQIRFSRPAAGSASGVVTDRTTRAPVPGATVDLYGPTGKLVRRVRTGDDGRYWFELLAGQQYRVAARKPPGYSTESSVPAKVTTDRQALTVNHVLSGGRLDVRAQRTEITPGRPATVRLTNSGATQLDWYATATPSRADAPAPWTKLANVRMGSMWTTGVEEVNGNYWVGGVTPAGGELFEVTEAGVRTGEAINLRAVMDKLGLSEQSTSSDLAWVPSRGMLCLTFDGLETYEQIVCLRPGTTDVVTLPLGFGPRVGPAGLAYDEQRDLFYVIAAHRDGGYQSRIRTIAGLDHQNPGEALNTCVVTRQVQGLGWNPTSRTLWANSVQQTGSDTADRTVLRQLDPTTCTEISDVALDPAYGLAYTGLDLDAEGNVLHTLGFGASFNKIATGDPIAPSTDWAQLSTEEGTLPARRTETLTVDLDWSTLPAEIDQFDLVLRGNGGASPKVTIPITVTR
ncbi:hypothetical protein BLA60_26255 [Actinophytocola xinjiangensis]|uniref:Peptidase S8/S53 domain-containing protein n=1 Tax=Actinophytocola xinjiangensis TaxID=485602 RepID=A0A7Z1AXK6_9PSEU|nr:S8 family serine peptidase [Actinophytocola xinjiangensis]OLF07822.1 hypothetical protein BLA60_26255 [Actinophytocola xinjiangensis]